MPLHGTEPAGLIHKSVIILKEAIQLAPGMGRFVDKEHHFALYNVPKGGGTTLRSWIYFSRTGQLAIKDEGAGYINQESKTYKYLKDIGYEVCDFVPWIDGPSVCVVRDPVDRFISLYRDKIVREKRCGEPIPTLGEFCRNFANLMEAHDFPHGANPDLNYLGHHFAPQSLIIGKNKDYFEHIFKMEEIDTSLKVYLEGKWGISLPSLHCRKAEKRSKIIPSTEELLLIREIYKSDYSLDWIHG